MVQYVNRVASTVAGIQRSRGSGSLDTTVPVATETPGASADAIGAKTTELIAAAHSAAIIDFD